MSTAGYVVAAVVTLLLGYLVPSLVRRRQSVGDARVPDRFSTSLRLVERRQATGATTSSAAILPGRAPAVIVRAEEHPVNRPAGMAERRTAHEARRVAAVRAALAARRAEQAAAARRRLVLTAAVAVVTVVAWVAVAVAHFAVVLALFPTLVLSGVLWLGVRSARAEREEWGRVPESLREPRAEAPHSGPAYSASQLREHLSATTTHDGAARVPAAAPVNAAPAAGAEDVAAADETGGLRWSTGEVRLAVAHESEPAQAPAVPGTWTPVPVPVPAYTLKATAAPRPQVEDEAYEGDQALVAAEAEVDEAREARAAERAQDQQEQPGIDLNAVLARRRGA